MYYIKSNSTNPYFNLALEQFLLENSSEEFFLLWQNDNAIIVGKHQNTMSEINHSYVKENNIKVVRRLSGGGAVYHDLGNVNFTFIVNRKKVNEFDFNYFCNPVMKVLQGLGIKVEFSGRNDMTIDGKKFSGNSQYNSKDRMLHHGTILFNSCLPKLGMALVVTGDKIESKGLKSVRSRVANLSEYLTQDINVNEFIDKLALSICEELQIESYSLSQNEKSGIEKLADEKYATWDWNYGEQLNYSIKKERRIENCGKIELLMNIEEGFIKELVFYGDFFSSKDIQELVNMLIDCKLEEKSLKNKIQHINISEYFHNLNDDEFINILLQ